MTDPIAFDISTDNGTTLVRVHDDVFADNRGPLLEALLHVADQPQPSIIVDLSRVTLCDSAALNMLIQAHQRATATGGWLHLTNPQPMVRRILQITNLDRLIPVQTDTGDDQASPQR